LKLCQLERNIAQFIAELSCNQLFHVFFIVGVVETNFIVNF